MEYDQEYENNHKCYTMVYTVTLQPYKLGKESIS